jgi:gluconate 2-dehydrogenase gamma chain
MLLVPGLAYADVIKGGLPWKPGIADPPQAAGSGPWRFFTSEEAAAVEAIVDRLIPPDPQTPGGKDAGCAVFIDRQLAGPYGRFEGHYRSGPFQHGTKEQGPQSPLAPAPHYRAALAALDSYCRKKHGAKFADLNDQSKDEILTGLEHGSIALEGTSGQEFFELIIKNTQHGFFADPIYGGNRDMTAWKMIGFPGARYDYRDWVERHNERFTLPPIAIASHPDWSQPAGGGSDNTKRGGLE